MNSALMLTAAWAVAGVAGALLGVTETAVTGWLAALPEATFSALDQLNKVFFWTTSGVFRAVMTGMAFSRFEPRFRRRQWRLVLGWFALIWLTGGLLHQNLGPVVDERFHLLFLTTNLLIPVTFVLLYRSMKPGISAGRQAVIALGWLGGLVAFVLVLSGWDIWRAELYEALEGLERELLIIALMDLLESISCWTAFGAIGAGVMEATVRRDG